ncbi:MAG: UPF0104 family protein [Candidatus Scalindua sp. AMX11]|nr:MAG: UPF0104 family protein [Candidatus Scalindua sp.]NOG82608.1 flippase-like domain-containing protein [Planctomycetota bacterium]RZV78317.1 MAG: flippase-like domain-containing protein [Candidatus Scalindua sp. SCAELEC01]TDE65134.1 MAG: UPF0104 family protein [Candidatus Scalindua sp. AMX11]GJQ59516.1 MAG: TIGR00374 family protein [Candidatus Scalindua sp.]
MRIREVLGKMLLPAILGAVALTSLGLLGDIEDVFISLRNFQWGYLPIIVVFGFGNDMIKFLRWDYYLKRLGIELSRKESLSVFIAGLAFSATPGKIGFIMKNIFLKKMTDKPIIDTSPVVFAELYTDFITLSLIALAGFMYIGIDTKHLILISSLSCLFLAIAMIKSVPLFCIQIAGKLPVLKNRTQSLKQAVEAMYDIMSPFSLLYATVISLLAWTSEGVALWFILKGLGASLTLVLSTIVFSIATLLGAVTMLPGGLIVTEGSLLGLLSKLGIHKAPAASATLLARLCTLWLAVLVGTAVLLYAWRTFNGKGERAINGN